MFMPLVLVIIIETCIRRFVHLQDLRVYVKKVRVEIGEPIKAELLKPVQPVQSRWHVLQEVVVEEQHVQVAQIADFAAQLTHLVVVQDQRSQTLAQLHQILRQLLQIVL